jgi:hypothetical protein
MDSGEDGNGSNTSTGTPLSGILRISRGSSPLKAMATKQKAKPMFGQTMKKGLTGSSGSVESMFNQILEQLSEIREMVSSRPSEAVFIESCL